MNPKAWTIGELPEWIRLPGSRFHAGSEEWSEQPARPLALAIGMFDGVHLGHRSVIESAIATARQYQGMSAVLTFDPHPSRLFRPAQPTQLILPEAQKTRILLDMGVDGVFVKTFDPDFASLGAEAFLNHLKTSLPTLRSIHVGENFHYGKGRDGDVSRMIADGRKLGIHVYSMDRFRYDGEPVSSSRLRVVLSEGDMDSANAMLGYEYNVEGPVLSGRRLGRTIGFPTLNLGWNPELRPRFGVYAVKVDGPEQSSVQGIANYGLRPTVESSHVEPRLEVHLLQSNKHWTTGTVIKVKWLHFIRGEQKFGSIDSLREQIDRDCRQAEQYFQS